MRKRNGDLHYYINGLDQGVAVSNLPSKVWGVVDMYGRTVKVTIVDRDVNEEKNLLTRLSNSLTLSNENQCEFNWLEQSKHPFYLYFAEFLC